MTNSEKAVFLRHDFLPALQSIHKNTLPHWGKMNLQQMIEHMSESFRIASGKIQKKLLTPEERLPRMYEFMMSEAPFKENTKNIEMSEEPLPVINTDIQDAYIELQAEIDHFFTTFEAQPELRIMNPFFGNLNYEEWIQLLHKHALHHLKQFGIVILETN